MVEFLLAICLFLMTMVGLASLLFASPRLPAVLWNFFWYWVIGNTAIRVFDSPQAGWLGIVFAILYILRARNARPIVFQSGTFGAGFPFPGQRHPSGKNTPPDSSRGDVIEAEVVETQSTSGKLP